ncbi:GNAT family N-acetyltransferase [Bacillus sp. SCS-153A]|uniref:GNAT family N-acetyltransferase n=1 Tax=Rossellomorea sedimentorum TaxID=3115294 RepID=UPI0039061ACE
MLKTIRKAVEKDSQCIKAFLERAGLSSIGVEETVDNFLMVENEKGEIEGTLGLEIQEQSGLLRSLVVKPTMNSEDLFALFQEILQLGKEKQLSTIYLLSNKQASIQFFHILGFKQVDTTVYPEELNNFTHAKALSTVDNPTIMRFEF